MTFVDTDKNSVYSRVYGEAKYCSDVV